MNFQSGLKKSKKLPIGQSLSSQKKQYQHSLQNKQEDNLNQKINKNNSTNKKRNINNKAIVKKQNFIQASKLEFKLYYNLEKKLGQGAFGQVFKIVHKKLKETRALKVIKKVQKQAYDSYDELELLKKLDHPNILKLYQYFQSQEKWYIITQFFEGKELFDQIIQDQKLCQYNAALIMYQILKPLVYIHSKNIAHRDIKAQNILVKKQFRVKKNSQGQQYQQPYYNLKLIDWGLGFLSGGQQMQRKCGTPQYCAPQVLSGRYTQKCDMWSVGVLLYIMLCGCMPFKGKNVHQTLAFVCRAKINLNKDMWKNISAQAKHLIKGLLQKNPQKRLSAEEVLKHPWILSNINRQKQIQRVKTSESLKQTLERIKQFNIENKLQVVIINFIHNFMSSPKEQQNLRKQFQMLDENNDGVLSFQQLLKGYEKIYGDLQANDIVTEIFLKLDLDHSGQISYSQFITFAMKSSRKYSQQQLKQAFRIFDRDNDGKISRKQLYNLIQYQKGTNDEQLQMVVNQLDFNDDGEIDFEQFLKSLNQSIKISIHKSKTKSGQKDHKGNYSSYYQNWVSENNSSIKNQCGSKNLSSLASSGIKKTHSSQLQQLQQSQQL